METLKVSSKSKARAVAGAIALSLQKSQTVKLCAIGAGAVNQACKAIAIASGYVAPKGMTFTVKINFSTVDIEDKEKTALEFTLTAGA